MSGVPSYDSFLIGNKWIPAASGEFYDVISPSDESVVGRVPVSTPADIDAAVAAARAAFDHGPWPHLTVRERGAYLLRIAELLEPRIDALVNAQIDEMGSTFRFIDAGTRGTLARIQSQIDLVDAIPTRMIRDVGGAKIALMREPMGVIGTIIPWNAPVPLIIARMLPAFLTGSTLIIKPAPESPLSAYIVAEAAIEAGLPDGVLSLVPGGREVGEYLVGHPGVDKISFTGSTAAGRKVAALCGQTLKRTTMELGGKSAALILQDADLDKHMTALINSAMPNTGQVCYATTRILVPRARSAEIAERLVAEVAAMKVGDPHDADTGFGPLAAARQRDTVEGYIRSGIDQGATVALGGLGGPDGIERGWFVKPTIFTGVDNAMKVAQEEIFGPVVTLIDYESESEAVAIANDSPFGLGGAIFTEDVAHGLDVAARIRTGTVQLNSGAPGGGGGPFGGMKNSGLGRERGVEGYEGYYELKSVGLPPGTF